MFETVVLFALIILMGLVAVLVKLPLSVSLRVLGPPVLTDVTVTLVVLRIHWGTVTGLMSATLAGLLCAGLTTVGRRLFAYFDSGTYHPGAVDLSRRFG